MRKNAVLTIGMVLMAAGIATGASDSRPVFVPWKVLAPGVEPEGTALLTLYWVPASADQMRRSSLIMSSTLAEYAGRCVAMHVIRADDAERLARLGPDVDLPVAMLAEGTKEIARVHHHKGALPSEAVEKMLREEIARRHEEAQRRLDAARKHAASGDRRAAAAAYGDVVRLKCAFPRLARSAQRAIDRIERSGRVGNASQHP
ncbi:MAG TPA: hypothetical protein VMS98_05925 [Thermoanaerobaculia bacterium]|nr:hypothetical protein [Thermoanaerobaculia bacterium]